MMRSVKNVGKEICTVWFKKKKPSFPLLPMGIYVSMNLTRDVERSTQVSMEGVLMGRTKGSMRFISTHP